MTEPQHIVILGIGNILLTDEGVGVRVIETLEKRYGFSDSVTLIDGGVMGLNLIGTLVDADHVVMVDAVRGHGYPGALYRLEADEIPEHFTAKSSLHEVGFPEILAACRALGKVPDIVVVGVEPQDIETPSLDLTPAIQGRMDEITAMVLEELDRLGVAYWERNP